MTAESDIVRAICDYLALKKNFFYRNNNLPTFDSSKKVFRRMHKYTPKGLPDIVVIKNGQYIGLEVKTRVGSTSPHQKAVAGLIRASGGIYEVVRSVDDVIALGL